MAIERTFIAVKPDGTRRGLVGEIVSRFERRGYTLVGAKLVMPSTELLEEHYIEHKGKKFLPDLLNYMGAGPVFAMCWEGENIIAMSRVMIGATRPNEAAPGTIRGDYCQVVDCNMVHGSDSLEAAQREVGLWFTEAELATYKPANAQWVNPSSQ